MWGEYRGMMSTGYGDNGKNVSEKRRKYPGF